MLTYDLSEMSRDELGSVLARAGVDLSGAMEFAEGAIREVREGGDAALLRLAREHDRFEGRTLRVAQGTIRSSSRRTAPAILRALSAAKRRIEAFHSHQSFEPFEYRDRCGVFGQKVVPLDRVGVYVPGGTASYASSVLMACVPARVAGVGEIAMCTPGRGGSVGDAVLAAVDMCGVDEVYAVGGAQAVAAMAYGTETVRRVQKIVGPGGVFVSAAKMLVRNDCEIDSLAGPSEVLVVADGRGDPALIASEMLAQLEHDPLARALLVTTSRKVMASAAGQLRRMAASSPRKDIVERSSESGAVFMLARDLAQALRFANDYAPEHLVLDLPSPSAALKKVRSAGSVFLGKHSSVSFGDYCSGPNHILPTMGTASMRSSLSTYDFLKVIPYQSITSKGATELAAVTEVLASAEGLPGHAQAASMRRAAR